MKKLVILTKITPILLAMFHCLNTILSYFYIDCIFLNYLSGVSIITLFYLYSISYIIKLCSYYRMFLHYCVILDIINIIDYYIGIPIEDYSMFLIYVTITIITMLVIIYLKFFKKNAFKIT